MPHVPARSRLIPLAVSVLATCAVTTLAVAPTSASTPRSTAAPLAAVAPAPQGPLATNPSDAPSAARSSAPAKVATQAVNSTLPVDHSCSSTLRVRAQQMTSGQLSSVCTSLAGQAAYFHNVVKSDSRPVSGDNNTSLEVVVFNSSSEYRRLAGSLYGVSTNNGGVYLEGNPSAPGNQARFIAYRDETASTFTVKNLNHEYTHYLDGRFNMFGDWNANISTPTLWWIEGLAEYVSYGYLQPAQHLGGR